uniref:Family with sequence similarity 177 member A1 n=1 Tax=Sinocyclocheilus rhinocerous TaxID=307959 RepID=A0A673NGU2_9TELE
LQSPPRALPTVLLSICQSPRQHRVHAIAEQQQHGNISRKRCSSKLTWGPYVWFQMWRVATSSISVCDYLGEKMASLLGITTPKYQYAIDEYYRMKKEEEEEEEENHLSEEAERRFEEQHNQDGQQPKIEQPEGTASFVNVTFELEQESHATSDANKVPAPIPS